MKTCSKCNIKKEDQHFYKKGLVCKVCQKIDRQNYYNQNKNKIHETSKKYMETNKEIILKKRKQYRDENKIKISNQQKDWRKRGSLFETYFKELNRIEEIKKGNNDLLMVKCTGCKVYFNPTNTQVSERIKALKSLSGTENRFYCCEECKINCPIYRQVLYNKIEKKRIKRETSKEFDQIVIKERSNECEKCGSKNKLQIHHIKGYTQYPESRFDLNNVLLLCKECHKKIHSQNGCKHNQLICKNMEKTWSTKSF